MELTNDTSCEELLANLCEASLLFSQFVNLTAEKERLCASFRAAARTSGIAQSAARTVDSAAKAV